VSATEKNGEGGQVDSWRSAGVYSGKYVLRKSSLNKRGSLKKISSKHIRERLKKASASHEKKKRLETSTGGIQRFFEL